MSAVLDNPELGPIKLLCEEAQRMTEGTAEYIFMQNLRFLVRGQKKEMDALLCLNYPNPTYPTKLFFPENLSPLTPGLNWNENSSHFARSWWTWSWKDVPTGMPPQEILAAHLKALQ